jgi:hypothetical protein
VPAFEVFVDRQLEDREVEDHRHVQLARADVLDELVPARLDQR